MVEAHARLQGAGLPERGSEIAGGRRHQMLSDNWQVTYGHQKQSRRRVVNHTKLHREMWPRIAYITTLFSEAMGGCPNRAVPV